MSQTTILRKSGTYQKKQEAFFPAPVKERGYSLPYAWNTSETKKYAGKELRTQHELAQAQRSASIPENLIRAYGGFIS